MKVRSFHCLLFSLLGCLAGVLPLVAKDGPACVYLHLEDYQIVQILPLPPIPGSELELKDRADSDKARASRTEEDVKRAKSQEADTVFLFSTCLGGDFTKENFPKTAEMFGRVTADLRVAQKATKTVFHRPRPESTEAKEQGKDNFSYPSSHSTRAFAWAVLLTELYPKKSQAILQRARQLAWDRVILGKHFPADVLAGRVFGEFLAAEMLSDETFQKDWQGVLEEVKAKGK